MNFMKLYRNLIILSTIAILFAVASCNNAKTKSLDSPNNEIIDLNKTNSSSTIIVVDFTKGRFHNHPLMAIWAESLSGEYLETFFVASSIGKGVFERASGGGGKWLPGPVRRPATLPYWAHKRGVKEVDGLYFPTQQTAMSDAVTGATPNGDFRLIAAPSTTQFPTVFNLLFEINQSWDWNQYWNNAMFPEEPEYKTSCQPSLVYSVKVNLAKLDKILTLNPIGHGHYSGKNGDLFTDLSTLTTALEISKRITVTAKRR